MPNKKQLKAVKAMIPGAEGLGRYRSIQQAWDHEAEKEVTVLVAWELDGRNRPTNPKILLKLFKDPTPKTLELMKDEPDGEIMYFGDYNDGPITSQMRGKIVEERVKMAKLEKRAKK